MIQIQEIILSGKEPQFRDSAGAIAIRQNIPFFKRIYIFLYYLVAKELPAPPMPFGNLGDRARTSFARRIFKKMGKDVKICKGAIFGSGVNVEIGDYSSLNSRCWISNDTIIGRDVMMGPEVIILSGSHNFSRTDVPMREQGAPPRRPVVIGNDVWIGTRSTILPGVRLGSHSIIGAGSVVTKDVPEWAIVGGNPVKLIRYRNKPRIHV